MDLSMGGSFAICRGQAVLYSSTFSLLVLLLMALYPNSEDLKIRYSYSLALCSYPHSYSSPLYSYSGFCTRTRICTNQYKISAQGVNIWNLHWSVLLHFNRTWNYYKFPVLINPDLSYQRILYTATRRSKCLQKKKKMVKRNLSLNKLQKWLQY